MDIEYCGNRYKRLNFENAYKQSKEIGANTGNLLVKIEMLRNGLFFATFFSEPMRNSTGDSLLEQYLLNEETEQ